METGFIGLGRMGKRMVNHLVSGEHRIIAYDADEKSMNSAPHCKKAGSVKELALFLKMPRIIFLMIPESQVGNVIRQLKPYLSGGDTVIDAGNSYYLNSIKHAEELASVGVYFLDVGTSGGLEGAATGASMTVGGDKKAFKKVLPLLKSLSAKDGLYYAGKSGAGHFVKMVHNAIEYGVLQAYGEGFGLLHGSPYGLKLGEIAHAWNHGSLIQSRFLDLSERGFRKYGNLEKIRGIVEGGQSGGWGVIEAKKRGLPFDMTNLAIKLRAKSRKKETFASKYVAVLRNEFGGHRLFFRE